MLEKSAPIRCVACRDELGSEALASCGDCAIQVHAPCLELLRDCPTLGCSGEVAALLDADRNARPSPSIEKIVSVLAALAASALVLLVAALVTGRALHLARGFNAWAFLACVALITGARSALRAAARDREPGIDPARPRRGGLRGFLRFVWDALDRGGAQSVTFIADALDALRRGLLGGQWKESALPIFLVTVLVGLGLPFALYLVFAVFSASSLQILVGGALVSALALVVLLAAWVNRDR